MKSVSAVLLFAAGLASAQDHDTAAKAASKKPVKQPAEVTIPANAVPTEDGSYRAVDKQGKAWIYRKTPFGIAKSAEKPPDDSQATREDTLTKATLSGDNVHFEKPSPFGITKWDKKVSDLDANEQRILDRQKTKRQ